MGACHPSGGNKMMEHWTCSEGMVVGYIYRPVHSKRRVGPRDLG